jgi:hypothetical protein
MIKRPSNNCVLEFIETNEMRRSIKVFSTEKDDVFKVVRGMNAKNQVVDTKMMGVEEIKQLWIDSVVNGYECVRNEIFMRGILDCLPAESVKMLEEGVVIPRYTENEPISVEEYNKQELEKLTAVMDILHSA